MLMKVKREIASLFSWRKTVLFLIGTVLCIHAIMTDYIKDYEGTDLCEFTIFFLTNEYIILMLVGMAVIILSSDKYGFQNRYVILIRYRSRFEFYVVNLCAKMVYAAGCVATVTILMIGLGKYSGLAQQPAVLYVQVSYGIVVKQCLNILGYAVLIVTVSSLLNILIQHKTLDVLVMMGGTIVQSGSNERRDVSDRKMAAMAEDSF